MANHLNMGQRETILTLHQQGWSKRKIARELKVDRGTVRRVLSGHVVEFDADTSKTPTPAEVLTGVLTPTASICGPAEASGRPAPSGERRQAVIDTERKNGVQIGRKRKKRPFLFRPLERQRQTATVGLRPLQQTRL